MEEWKAIEGYEGLYEVSNMGNVKSYKRYKDGKLLKPRKSLGYLSVMIYDMEENSSQPRIHTLVANAFVENPDNKPCIDHIDQNKHNNCADNLRWATKSDNAMNVPKKDGSSKYKGVHWDKSRNKWVAKIKVMYKNVYLGRFDTEEEAAKAYDSYIIQHLADFGILNFPK